MVPNQTNNNTSYNLGSLDAYRSRLEAIPSGKSLLLMRLFYPAEFHRILAARSKAYARTNPISQNNTQAQGTTPMRDNVAYLAGYMSKQAEITPNEDAPNTEGEDQSKKKDAKPEGDAAHKYQRKWFALTVGMGDEANRMLLNRLLGTDHASRSAFGEADYQQACDLYEAGERAKDSPK